MSARCWRNFLLFRSSLWSSSYWWRLPGIRFKKINDFGIKFIYLGIKSIECERHYFFTLLLVYAWRISKKKTPNEFVNSQSMFNFDKEKHRIKQLLAFLKQQSGEANTKIPPLRFEFRPQTSPELDTDWLKWKSKATELFKRIQFWKGYVKVSKFIHFFDVPFHASTDSLMNNWITIKKRYLSNWIVFLVELTVHHNFKIVDFLSFSSVINEPYKLFLN